MSKKPFVSQNNLFSSKNLFEKEEDNISLKSNDIISFPYEIDNLNKNETGKVNSDNFVSDFNPKTLNQLFGVKNKFKSKFVLKNKKRGRPSEKISKKETHHAYTYDNILRKIQTHFLNFMLSFINDCIKSLHESKRMNLKNINYAEKRKIKKSYLEKVKNATINEIINNADISIKYKKYDKDINRKNVTKLSKNSFFENLFKMNFLELFSIYYNKSQPLDKLLLFNKTINLSKKTKPFYKLLETEESHKKYFIEIAKMNYINDIIKNEKDKQIGESSEDNIYQRETNNSINIKDDE